MPSINCAHKWSKTGGPALPNHIIGRAEVPAAPPVPLPLKSLPHRQMMAILNEHWHCINCLKPGHFVKQCPCGQKCWKCQKPHHTSLHIDKEARKQTKRVSPSNQMPGAVTHHSDLGGCHPVVLTPCQVQIVSADSTTTKARALLDLASSTSFVTESLAQCLHLRRRHHSIKVGGIDGSTTRLSSRGMVDLNISNHCGKTLAVEVVVLPKVTTNLASCPVQLNRRRKHLSNIRLANPNFGNPGSVDLFLVADVFSRAMFHSWRLGPSGSPSAFKTCFSWVFVGATHTSSHSN